MSHNTLSGGQLDNDGNALSLFGNDKSKTEEEGFEPPEPYGSTVFKTVAKKCQPGLQQAPTESDISDYAKSLASILQKYPELNLVLEAWPDIPDNLRQQIVDIIENAELSQDT